MSCWYRTPGDSLGKPTTRWKCYYILLLRILPFNLSVAIKRHVLAIEVVEPGDISKCIRGEFALSAGRGALHISRFDVPEFHIFLFS
jgi:hypothetical protein